MTHLSLLLRGLEKHRRDNKAGQAKKTQLRAPKFATYCLLVILLFPVCTQLVLSGDEKIQFDIPPAKAPHVLNLFAQQAGVQLLYPYDLVDDLWLKGLSGVYDIDEGLTKLLANTCLEAGFSTNGRLVLKINNNKRLWFMKRQKCSNLAKLSQIAGALLAVTSSASADVLERESTKATSLDEVIVTARRTEEQIQDVPVSVTAYSGEQIKSLVVENALDLNKLSPGLQVETAQASRARSNISIRGQGESFNTGESSVVPYFADIPKFQLSYYDLESLQVVKGPQGTLFGETATGGVILVAPRKPGNETDGYLRLQAGNDNFSHVEGAFGGALIEDKLMARIAGQVRKRDGFMTVNTNHGPSVESDNIDDTQWRLSLVWTPMEGFENYTVYAGSKKEANAYASPLFFVDTRHMTPGLRFLPWDLPFVPGQAQRFEALSGYSPEPGKTFGELIEGNVERQLEAGPFQMFSSMRDKSHASEFTGFVNQTTWDLSDSLTLQNIYGVHWTKERGPILEVDASDIPLVTTFGSSQNNNLDEFGNGRWTGGRDGRTWTNEIRLLGQALDEKLDWQTGVYHRELRYGDWSGGGGNIVVAASTQGSPINAAQCLSGGKPTGVQCLSRLTREQKVSDAVFAQGTYTITDAVSATLGYRRTWDQRKLQDTVGPTLLVDIGDGYVIPAPNASPGRLAGAAVNTTTAVDASEDTYTIGIDWKPTDSSLVYAVHRKGYKSGGVNSNSPEDSPGRFFGPEFVKNFELGAKVDWSIGDMLARTNVTAFRDKYQDIQRSQILPGSAQTITTNLADATIQGVELELTLVPTDWFELSGFYAWIDAEYDSWTEQSNCAAKFRYPQCFLLPPSTLVVVDHANGLLTIGDTTTGFTPDRISGVSEHRWNLRPALHLNRWLNGEDVTLSANIQYRSGFTSNDENNSVYAVLPEIEQETILGTRSNPFDNPGFTLVDVRFDWRNVMGSAFDVAGVVTNLTDKTYGISNAGGFTTFGVAPTVLGEPRMWYLELHYKY